MSYVDDHLEEENWLCSRHSALLYRSHNARLSVVEILGCWSIRLG